MTSWTPVDPNDPLQARRAVLPNGLTVLFSPNRETPRVYCRVVVRAGAAQEPRETTGLAHYLEHMLANKGSEELGTVDRAAERPHLEVIEDAYERMRDGEVEGPLREAIAGAAVAAAPFAVPNELKQLHGRLGSRAFNAFTSHDQTSYVVDLAAERFAAWARVEADRFRHPVFRSFPTEVETICEEKKRALDDPRRSARRAMMGALFAGHPYGTPVLGLSEHLERPSMRAMRAFYDRWYVPQNMAVVLSGDLDADEVLDVVARWFGELRGAETERLVLGRPAALEGETRVRLAHRGAPELRIGWRTVDTQHDDVVALDLVDEVLHNGGVGRLDALVQRQEARAAGSYHSARLDAGVFCLWGRPRVGQTLAELEGQLLRELNAVREGEVAAEDLRAIVRNVEVDELAGRESSKGRVRRMADAWMRGEDPCDTDRRLRALRALTVEQVVEAARRWLGPERVVVEREEGEPDLVPPQTPPIPPLPPGASEHSPLFHEVLATPAVPVAAVELVEGRDFDVTSVQGVRVVSSPNPHSGLTRISMRWELGWEGLPGLSSAVRLAREGGAGGRSREEIERGMFDIATTVEARAGRWTTDVAFIGPAETWREALAIERERWTQPEVTREEAHAVVDDLLLRREQARETRAHRISALAAWSLRGEQSVFLLRPTPDELRELADGGPAPLTATLERGAVVAMVSGPVDPAELARELGVSREPHPEISALDYVRPTADRVLLLHDESAQAQVTIHSPQYGYRADDYGPRRIWSEVMGGAAGLVFSEIREKRGMAYSAHAGWSNGWRAGDANLAWLRVGTDSAKAASVAELLMEMLREFPAGEDRIARARTGALARRRTDRIGFASIPATVEDWRGKGIGEDPIHAHLAALERCSDADVREFGREVAAAPVTVCVVGDLNRIDRAALAALGEVTELSLDAIER